jgi:hypothetical protein
MWVELVKTRSATVMLLLLLGIKVLSVNVFCSVTLSPIGDADLLLLTGPVVSNPLGHKD